MTSVGLRLCVGLVDSYELRLFAVEKLLTMMADPALSKVTKLRLENLQLSNDVEYMQSDKVLNVLSRLTALDLAFSAAYYTVSDYEEEEYASRLRVSEHPCRRMLHVTILLCKPYAYVFFLGHTPLQPSSVSFG